MAERRNAGILNILFLFTITLVPWIVGCRPAPHISAALVELAPPPVEPPVAPTNQLVNPDVQAEAVTQSATPSRVAVATRKSTPTVYLGVPAVETETATPFATLDSAWPTSPLPVSSAAIPLDKPDNVVNIVLLGNDVPWAQGGRTDSVIIVSLNRETRRVTFLSIPRDLYVVIPGWMVNRINLALPHGHGTDYPGGGGALVKDTILYNLGIPIDYYVRIGFAGFKEIVDALGGVEIAVNCPIDDWQLRSADLDPEIEENWELIRLDTGVQQMDGELALWYVRSRRNSNDIDRGRRQQKVVRAILQEAKIGDMLARFPGLWEGYAGMFETDMQLRDVLELAALAPDIEVVEHLLLTGDAVRPWTVPNSGEAVQLLDRDASEPVLRQLMGDTALHGASRAPVQVEVETNDPILYRLVADNLHWYGFAPSFLYRDTPDPAQTTIEFKGANGKGAFADRLSHVFRLDEGEILFNDEGEARMTGYHVTLGKGHDPCLSYLEAAQP